MIQKQISTAEVEDVLAKPDGLVKQSQDKIIAHKKMSIRTDNALAVVAVERAGNFIVGYDALLVAVKLCHDHSKVSSCNPSRLFF